MRFGRIKFDNVIVRFGVEIVDILRIRLELEVIQEEIFPPSMAQAIFLISYSLGKVKTKLLIADKIPETLITSEQVSPYSPDE